MHRLEAAAAVCLEDYGFTNSTFSYVWEQYSADSTINYGVISATGIWYVQVAALVGGHICGLILAHDRAISMYQKCGFVAESRLRQRSWKEGGWVDRVVMSVNREEFARGRAAWEGRVPASAEPSAERS